MLGILLFMVGALLLSTMRGIFSVVLFRFAKDGVVGGGFTEQELADAKTYLSGALALSLDSSGSVASLMHSLQVDGLSPDHLVRREALIAAVKIDSVRRVARRLLREETMTTIVVGKPVGVVSEPKE